MKKIAFFQVTICLILIYATSALAGNAMMYRVSENDCLIRIGKRFLKQPEDWRKVAQLNGIGDPYAIYPGQKLAIPDDLLKVEPFEAEAIFVSGNVSVKRDYEDRWGPLDIGALLGAGTRLRTGSNSVAEILYRDGSFVRLSQDTELLIELSTREGNKSNMRSIIIDMGRAVFKVVNHLATKNDFVVKSGSSVLGVRGTNFRYAVDKDESSRAEVIEGHVNISAEGQTVALSQGEGTLVKKGQAPLPPVVLPAPPLLKDLATSYQNIDTIPLPFDPVPGAVAYRLVLTRDEEMSNWVMQKFVSPGDELRLLENAEGNYFMALTSINSIGLEGVPSPVYQFSLRRQHLSSPEFTSVLDSRIRNGMVSCRWNPVEGAEHYQVQVAEDGKAENIVQDRAGLDSRSVSLTGLDAGIEYQLRIRSVDAHGYSGAWSETRQLPANTD